MTVVRIKKAQCVTVDMIDCVVIYRLWFVPLVSG